MWSEWNCLYDFWGGNSRSGFASGIMTIVRGLPPAEPYSSRQLLVFPRTPQYTEHEISPPRRRLRALSGRTRVPSSRRKTLSFVHSLKTSGRTVCALTSDLGVRCSPVTSANSDSVMFEFTVERVLSSGQTNRSSLRRDVVLGWS